MQGQKKEQGHRDRDRNRNTGEGTGTVTGVGTQGKGPREPKEALRYTRKGTGTETQGHSDSNRDKIIY